MDMDGEAGDHARACMRAVLGGVAKHVKYFSHNPPCHATNCYRCLNRIPESQPWYIHVRVHRISGRINSTRFVTLFPK